MELTPSDLWTRVLETVRQGMPEQSYRTWLAASRATGLTDSELLIEAPSEFHVEWMEDKYGPILHQVVEKVAGRPLKLVIRCSDEAPPSPLPDVEVTSTRIPAPPGPGSRRSGSQSGPPPTPSLNERYTFDRFVVGNNNQLAWAASRAVSEKPARMYNPLFLYGNVGLGKTHLMHAVGHAILEQSPGQRVAYVTAEGFMNEMVNSIQKGTNAQFRQKYREIDLLLVDDVHFLERKEATQEEFFHTFNALHDARKQIILTSDSPPKDLPQVEDRLVSRFEWGLVVDIKSPDYETRVAILRKKAADDNFTLDDEVMDYIARSCTSSVRELEGAVIKLLAYSSLRREDITVELARTALKGMLRSEDRPSQPRLTPAAIRDRVAEEWNVTPEALASRRRTKDVTVPRQVAMFLIKELLDPSLVQIGRSFGDRDHSTVIHSIRKIEGLVDEDPEFASRVDTLRRALATPGKP